MNSTAAQCTLWAFLESLSWQLILGRFQQSDRAMYLHKRDVVSVETLCGFMASDLSLRAKHTC